MKEPFYLILNGGEAVGKGTQKAKLLEGHEEWVQVREPGGTKEAEVIRAVILEKDMNIDDRIAVIRDLAENKNITALCKHYLLHAKEEMKTNGLSGEAEAYLYAASRQESNQKIVVPAKREGKTIVGDRSVACSMAYQGKARGQGMDFVWNLNRPTLDDAYPDLEIFLDLPLEESTRRLEGRTEKQDRMDLETSEFHRNVREGYKDYYENFCPYPYEIIDASGTIEEVHEKIKKVIDSYQTAKAH